MASPPCLKCSRHHIHITARGLCDPCYRIEARAGTLDANYPPTRTPARIPAPGDPTLRQIVWWIDRGYIRPANIDAPQTGSGHRWVWSDEEWAVARLIVRLTRAGLTLHVAARVARGETDLGDGITIHISAQHNTSPDLLPG